MIKYSYIKHENKEIIGISADDTTRASLAGVIRSFLNSEITSFEFDDLLDPYRSSDDPVIRHVTQAVWCHYDDCKDHLVCMSKAEWDYFQRLLLILATNCRVETHHERIWSVRQLFALNTLIGFIYCAFQTGWGSHLIVLAIPFGLCSIGLSLIPARSKMNIDPYQSIVYPFATFSDLANAYHSTTFRKSRYPNGIKDRSIRTDFSVAVNQIQLILVYLIFSPIPLICQVLPKSNAVTRVYFEC